MMKFLIWTLMVLSPLKRNNPTKTNKIIHSILFWVLKRKSNSRFLNILCYKLYIFQLLLTFWTPWTSNNKGLQYEIHNKIPKFYSEFIHEHNYILILWPIICYIQIRLTYLSLPIDSSNQYSFCIFSAIMRIFFYEVNNEQSNSRG